ncbi:hypothetical protein [Streptomyces aidingensis]|uniref:C2H2-type domain-containing protein n=1 Tax=Streptomyces aidingensis TaxID=910347 RepID=A0A1I1H2T1_9ACTN|nr:hypothetical protein [Streptomyces aidingensis]SFC15763.1 hypothetical protein SAMN05421773_102153 [Streptomyces aidingensis]
MRDTRRDTVFESYAFACLNCGYGWEQTYRIEHHLDPQGQPYVLYFAGEERVPSPLARLRCPACEGRRVRIMRAGLVAAVDRAREAAPAAAAQQPGPATTP